MATVPPPEDFDWEKQVGARPWKLRPRDPRMAKIAGYFASQLVGFCSLGLVTAVFTHFDTSKMSDLAQWTQGILGYSHFFLIPFAMGIVLSFFWLELESQSGPFKATFFNTMLACACAIVFLREGIICLFMASGILWATMAVGFSVGNRYWRKNPFLNVSLVPLLLILAWSEASFPASKDFSTVTDFHSKASPAQLWKYTASYPRNEQPTEGLLFAMGMPAPSSCGGSPIRGGRRDCLLTGNIGVGSKIVEAKRNESLEFVFDRQPQHPEITHHFVLQRGRIDLIPDGQGGTLIRGTSWYRLSVAPMAYFSWWSASVVHSTHWRVFKWMDALATRDA